MVSRSNTSVKLEYTSPTLHLRKLRRSPSSLSQDQQLDSFIKNEPRTSPILGLARTQRRLHQVRHHPWLETSSAQLISKMDPSGFDFASGDLWAQLSPQQQQQRQNTQHRRSQQGFDYSSDFSQEANFLYNAGQQPGLNPYPLVSQGIDLNGDHMMDPRFQQQWMEGSGGALGMVPGPGYSHSHSHAGMMDAQIPSHTMASSQWGEGYVQYSNNPTHGTPYTTQSHSHHHSQQRQHIPHYSGDIGTFPLVVPSSSSTDNMDQEWPRDSQSPSPTLLSSSLKNALRNSSSSGSSTNTFDGVLGGGAEFSSIAARRAHVLEWMSRTALTPQQSAIAHVILTSKWWELEEPEPEVRHNDDLVKRGLLTHIGGSRFRAFLDEENGYRCTFDHDGAPCTHGKGRTERALGTIRGFFRYKPVVCTGGCGTRCNQRFVSVEQCQKHVQKKRSGRATCPDCGSSILPANMSRHRRACHVQEGTSTRPQ